MTLLNHGGAFQAVERGKMPRFPCLLNLSRWSGAALSAPLLHLRHPLYRVANVVHRSKPCRSRLPVTSRSLDKISTTSNDAKGVKQALRAAGVREELGLGGVT